MTNVGKDNRITFMTSLYFRRNPHLLRIVSCAGLTFVFLCLPVWADVIQLNDGRTITGEIIETGSLQTVIKDDQGKVSRFYKEQIANIIEGELVTQLAIDKTQFNNISSQKVDFIIRLIESNGTRLNLEKNIEKTIKAMPEATKKKMGEILDINEIISELIPVYDRYFSQEEIITLVEFYESPAGKKMREIAPEIITEVTKVSVEYFRKKLTLPN